MGDLSIRVSDEFKQNLADLIAYWSKRPDTGSLNKLALKINSTVGYHAIAQQELQRWKTGQLTRMPSDNKISELAIAVGIPGDAITASAEFKRYLMHRKSGEVVDPIEWLKNNTQTAQKEGCDPPTEVHSFKDKIAVTEKSDLLSLIAQAPIEWHSDILRTLADRVDWAMTPAIATVPVPVTYQPAPPLMHTPEFLDRLLRQNGVDPSNDDSLIQFIGEEEISLSDLKDWLAGRSVPDDFAWGEIVLAINTRNGVSIGQEGSITERDIKEMLREFCQNGTNHTQHV